MKKFICLGASLAAIAALSSCNKDLESTIENPKDGIPFEICALSVDTKTSIDGLATSWVADDAINLFHAKSGTTNYTSDGQFIITAENLASRKFTGKLASALESETYDWYAIYPYKEQISSPADQTDGYVYIGHSVAIYQNGNDSKAHLCGSPCPLYGVSKSIDASSLVSLEMKHLTSVVEINVTNSNDEPLTVSNISISTDEDIVGSYYINFAGETVVYNPSNANNVKTVANLTVQNGTALAKGETASFYIPIKPHVAENGSAITITVNGYEKTISLTKDVTFTAGKIKKINFAYDYVPTLDTFTAINDISKLSDGCSLLIVGKSDDKYYQLPVNPTVSKGKISGVEVTVTDNTIKADALKSWTATKSGNYWQLTYGGNNIYHSNGGSSGTDLSYGNSTAYPWNITNQNTTDCTFKLAGVVYTNGTPSVKARGMLMSGTTFGGYALSNISNTAYSAIMLFVKEEAPSTDPAIIADDITNISARGLSAVELACRVENPVEGVSLSATCDGTVVTEAEVIDGVVLYSVAQNLGEARDGSITLTYGAINKTIMVSQLAPVFKVSRTSVELEAEVGSYSSITVTSDFDWTADASNGAGFTANPTTCEWNTENPYTDGKTTVTITASAANDSEEGAKSLGTLTFTNVETGQAIEVTVTQKTSYVAPVLGNRATGNLTSGTEGLTLEEGKAITYSEIKKGTNYKVYTNPARFYADNEFVVSSSSGNITKITITCSASYVTVLETTMKNSKLGTVTKSSNDVTLVLTTPSTTVTLTNSAQWRAYTMTVEYD